MLYFYIDRREAPRGTLALPPRPERFAWRHLLRFRSEYWLLVAVCVTFYSVIFPFRSTFAIKYLQEAQGFTLAQASTLNSYVFLAAVFATPVFGLLLDRLGRNAALLAAGCGAAAAELPGDRRDAPGCRRRCSERASRSCRRSCGRPWCAIRPRSSLGTAYGLMTTLQNAGLFAANLAAGYINDTSHASAANPSGYAPMLWFFGLLSLAAFACTVALWLRDQRREALPAAPAPAAIEP